MTLTITCYRKCQSELVCSQYPIFAQVPERYLDLGFLGLLSEISKRGIVIATLVLSYHVKVFCYGEERTVA